MLPSRGFFKKIDCPFFEKDLCGRPHCHFRHKKKVTSGSPLDVSPAISTVGILSSTISLLSHENLKVFGRKPLRMPAGDIAGEPSRRGPPKENSSSTDSQDLPVSDNLADISLRDNVDPEIESSATEEIDCATYNKDVQHSIKSAEPSEGKSQDSLFAKLVNQPNPYEKISRHIPCAYTPTPQVKGAQPKNRAVAAPSSKNSVNGSKALEILAKTQKDSVDYSSLNAKQNSSDSVQIKSQELSNLQIDVSSSSNNEPKDKYSVNFTTSSALSSTNSICKIPFFESKDLDSLSYELQATSKSIVSDLDKNVSKGATSDYMPSKITIPESKYSPNVDDSASPVDYVPSKDKPQQTQYVPESSVSIKNVVSYKPSDKSSARETQYQPGSSNIVADYVPTEKSATKSSAAGTALNWHEDGKYEWTDFDFITSEIEMMRDLLKEDTATSEEKKKIQDEIISKTELPNTNEKQEESDKKLSSFKSSHSSSSRHKTKSSDRSHSSSKSKHSNSSRHSSHGSNSSSRRHSSSSSRHHSSSKSKKSSAGDHKKSDGSRKSSADRRSRKSRKRSKERRSKERKSHSEMEKSSSSDEDITDGFEDEKNDFSEEEEGEMSESEVEETGGISKKRKNETTDEERNIKLMKKSEGEEMIFVDLEDDPDAVEKECLEIFNSYSNPSEENPAKKPIEIPTIPVDECENASLGKKRTAHSTSVMSDHSVLRQKTVRKLNNIKSAQETMIDRYKAVEKTKETSAPAATHQPAPILGLSRPSIRIAAVSNIQQMLQAKKAIQEKINQGMKVNERTTIAQTVSQGGCRVAHTPTSKDVFERPTISIGTKQIPRVKRQIYLDKLILETNQIYPTKSESAEEALRLEEEVFQAHSNSFSAYHAAFVSMLMKTRRRITALKGETFSSSNPSKPKMSHSDVLSGGKKNFSVIKTKKVDISMLSDRHIYEELLRCKLTEEELKLNSFPVESDRPGYASCTLNYELKYNTKYLHIKKLTGNRRYCIRCSKQYEVHPKTLQQYIEGPYTCSYHPGRKKSGGRNSERIYNCCNSASTEGCTTHVRHVTDCNDYDNLPNCVKTLSKNETNPGVFALDCEMVYTRLGCELARVTVVNLKKEIVYDTLVKPKYPIECYNTFYSGIEEKMLEGVTTTLKDVQAVLLSMFSDKTILIGHSLDSDLRALHLIHSTVVDTAVVYKNEKYHPYRYSLKDLCAKKISKIIQDNVGGHDSAEDAKAALEIMLNYVKEEVSKYDSIESYESDRMVK